MNHGERAYEAYRSQRYATNPDTNEPLSKWDYLDQTEQGIWEQVAEAVLQSLVNKPVTVRDNGQRKVGRVEAVDATSVTVIV